MMAMMLAALLMPTPLLAHPSPTDHQLPSQHPAPPRQTPTQLAKMRTWRSGAQRLSAAATPALHAYLDSVPFRASLRDCCPEIAAEPAPELAQRIAHELETAELVHNIGSGGDSKVRCCVVSIGRWEGLGLSHVVVCSYGG